MKAIKQVSLIFILFIIITFAILWALTKTVTPNMVKDMMSERLNLLTHEQSHIEGNVSWYLFPRPGIKVTNVHVGDKNPLSPYSLQIDKLLFHLQITPLLRGHLVFNELNIDGFKINVIPSSLHSKDIKLAPVIEKNRTKNELLDHFALEHLLLTHGEMTLIDPQRKIILSKLQIGANQVNMNQHAFPIQLKTTLTLITAQNKMKTSVNYKGKIQLSNLSLNEPLFVLQKAIMEGQLQLQNVRFNQFKMTRIIANLQKNRDELTLNPMNILLYSGESVGNLSYQFDSKKLFINQTASHLIAAQLSKDLFDKPLVKGSLDFTLHATTQFSEGEWLNHLSGNGYLTMRDGILYDIDLNKLMNETQLAIHSLLTQEKKIIQLALQKPLFDKTLYQNGNTPFELLNIQYHLDEAKIISDSLLFQTDHLQIKGHGSIHLNTLTQDLKLFAKMRQNSSFDIIQKLFGGTFPITVTGTLDNPIVSPNNKELEPIILGYVLKNTVEKPVKEVKQELQNIFSYKPE